MTRPPRMPLPVRRRSGGGALALQYGVRHVAVRHRPGLHNPPRGRRGALCLCTWCLPRPPDQSESSCLGLPRHSLVEGGEDLTPAPRRGKKKPAQYLKCWALSTAVHGPRERNIFFFLCWVGVSLTLATGLSLRGGRTCTRMSTARRASEVLLLLPSVSAAHAAPPTWRPALCSSGGHPDQRAVLHGGVRRAGGRARDNLAGLWRSRVNCRWERGRRKEAHKIPRGVSSPSCGEKRSGRPAVTPAG